MTEPSSQPINAFQRSRIWRGPRRCPKSRVAREPVVPNTAVRRLEITVWRSCFWTKRLIRL